MTEKKIPLPEAPASVNFKGVTKGGFICQWTLRDDDEDVLLEKQILFMNKLSEGGVHPYPATRQPEGNGSPPPASVPPPASDPPPQTQEDLFFEAESMAATTESGKAPRWKVKGGKYMEWGVTIWPEVLEAAGFDPNGLDPSTVYNLEGYTAYCEANEKGNPKKVVNLSK